MKIGNSELTEYGDYLGLFFLMLLGIAIPLSIAATNIIASLALLCFCCAGQYRVRWQSIIATPYSRMSLIFFGFLLLSGVLGLVFDQVPLFDMLQRLLNYKKLLLIIVMIGLLATARDAYVQKWCFIALLLGALINVVVILFANLSQSPWIVSSRGIEGAAIFSNTTATGFVLSTLFWCSGVLWLSTEHTRFYWFSVMFATAIFLLNVNVNRTSLMIFPVLVLGIIVIALKMHRERQEGRPWGVWFKIGGMLLLSVYFGAFFHAPNVTEKGAHQENAVVVSAENFKNVVGQIQVTMSSIRKATNGNFETSVGTRLRFYQNALLLIAHDPVLGCGIGCILHEYTKTYGDRQGEVLTDNLHSEYVNLLVQTGILGLFIFGLWISALWKSQVVDLPYARKFRLGMIVIFLMFCIVNSSLMDFHEGWLFCYFTALCVAPKKET